MRRKPLLWKIFTSYLLLILLSMLAVAWSASRSQTALYKRHVRQELENIARLVEQQIAGVYSPDGLQAVQPLCRALGRRSNLRLTIIEKSGRVIGDSMEDPALMDSHADRPEILMALSGRSGYATRYSNTLKQEMMYVAVAFNHGGRLAGTVRASRPLTEIREALHLTYRHVAYGGFGIVLLAALISWAMARRITNPLHQMQACARRFARGDFKARMHTTDSTELSELAETMNNMASELDERIRTVVQQRNELKAILGSMVEGVLAIDCDQQLISANQAAADMLGLKPAELRGRPVQETIRNTSLLDLIATTLQASGPVEDSVLLYHNAQTLYLKVCGTPLTDADKQRIGALIVLNDVTRLRRLENVRRDFAANVSHEIKTPITSIKGFVETLLDGALDNREDARHFLKIILKHTDRLNAIIEDLLLLSSIECGNESEEGIPLHLCALHGHLEDVLQACNRQASKKQIQLELQCPSGLQANLNPVLLEQAVGNLVQNAIKYSSAKNRVIVSARQTDRDIRISVQDFGSGISQDHLARLFERFYRVDKGRSRKEGGTGLGLAIVKHVAQAHGGSVSATSTVGEGSTFVIHLPKL